MFLSSRKIKSEGVANGNTIIFFLHLELNWRDPDATVREHSVLRKLNLLANYNGPPLGASRHVPVIGNTSLRVIQLETAFSLKRVVGGSTRPALEPPASCTHRKRFNCMWKMGDRSFRSYCHLTERMIGCLQRSIALSFYHFEAQFLWFVVKDKL